MNAASHLQITNKIHPTAPYTNGRVSININPCKAFLQPIRYLYSIRHRHIKPQRNMADKITTKQPAAVDAVDAASIIDGTLDEKVGPKSDDAAEFLHLHQSKYSAYSVQDAKKLLRKIDWRLMPLMWITTNLSAIDASNPLNGRSSATASVS